MIAQYLRRVVRRLGSHPGMEHDPAAGSEQGASWYDQLYRQSGAFHVPYYRSHYYFLWAVIADRIRLAGAKRVLEIGCGPAQLATLLLEQGVEHYAGLDFSPQALAMARQNMLTGQFVQGDARTTTIHEEFEHDIVLCTEVLEHIEDDLAVVARFRPGKRCLFSVPNFPYPGHVRHFRDSDEVRTRYAPFFHELDVVAFKSPNSTPNRIDVFFLADGVRNEFRAQPA
jgi:2-polyprenyl-3-methyl-5-hydroxy-6-metoxy-1,4-benzoquinol methylase